MSVSLIDGRRRSSTTPSDIKAVGYDASEMEPAADF